ncbi:MAG: hypothetical protein MUE85_20855 [Microscillaceae bacterium]|jgi:hypothetical protein|nr:hypothetical protein [Microscillaceae bacterium]
MKKLYFFILMTINSSGIWAQTPDNQPKTFVYTLGSATIKVVVYEQNNPNQITYFNLHDNENTSVEATQVILKNPKNSGKLVELQHSGERLISFEYQGAKYQIDPNRMFTKVGIEKNLKNYGNYSDAARDTVFAFGQKIYRDFLQGSRLIVAMHNNKNEGYNVKSYLPGGEYKTDAQDVFYNPKWGTGEFFYVIDQAHFAFFKQKKVSAVLQDPQKVTDDGSLSVFAQNQGMAYLNVEAQHGNLKPQIKMLTILQDLLQKIFAK